eukprot:CAMPEP_0180222152 /NCGR_PEP_ID=MMETSP0987-20121128/20474_1 /TAXON_ID=697907 /ORGANISM="non described non described, Strain CCMP2293" /LENGTH=34 /DNA_ID= /DNA_START= /DNA_END= /DNA_ORIENTATION=
MDEVVGHGAGEDDWARHSGLVEGGRGWRDQWPRM